MLSVGLRSMILLATDACVGVRAEFKKRMHPSKRAQARLLLLARIGEYCVYIFFPTMMWPSRLKFIVDDTS